MRRLIILGFILIIFAGMVYGLGQRIVYTVLRIR